MAQGMTARQVADILSEIATLLELHGGDDFRISAYRRAARSLEAWGGDIAGAVEQGTLTGIPGIGRGLGGEIAEIVGSGGSGQLQELLQATPPGLLDILQIRGLGAKKVRLLHQQLGVESLGELEYACLENRVASLKGFGEKSQQNILDGIANHRRNKSRFRLDVATIEAEHLLPLLLSIEDISRAQIAGNLRRGAEHLDNLQFVVASNAGPDLVAAAVLSAGILHDVSTDGNCVLGTADATFPVQLFVVDDADFAVELHRRTGARDYFFMMSLPLQQKGYDLNDQGLFKDGHKVQPESESQLFDLAGMQFIPPELREGIDEVPRALNGDIPALVTAADMKGMLHVHSAWSDGQNSIAELAACVHDLGYKYLLMCDHSKAAFYANGLDEKRLEKQGREIDQVNKTYDPAVFRVLKGVECDILADGRLDLDDDALAALDAVVVSVHSSFRLPPQAQTERLCRAVANPYTTILGHPTGRLLLAREGYQFDMKQVIETAAAHGRSIELNANPHRLDISWRMLRFALKKNVPIAVNPDAHSLAGFDVMRYGITMARKGWLTRPMLLNALDCDQFLAYAAGLRKK